MNKKLIGTVATLMSLGTFVPVSFASTFNSSAHGQFKSSIVLDGEVLSSPYGIAASDGSTTTTFMPLYYLDKALAKAGFSASWDGQTHTLALTSLQDNIDFSSIPVGTGNTSITVNGKLVKKINVIVEKDPAGGKKAVPTTYAPIYYLEQLLKTIGVQSDWDGSLHKWIAVSPKVLTTGTLGPDTGTQTVNSDVYVKGDGVTLQNLSVNGSIYLDPGANGSAYLNHVTVSGKIVILSGADHSIHFDNVTANNVVYHSSSPVDTEVNNSTLGTITITNSTGSNKVTVNVSSGTVGNVVDSTSAPVVLQGQGYQVVTADANSNVEISGKVDTLNINSPSVTVSVDSNASVSNVTVGSVANGTSITDNGTIGSLTNNSSSSVSVGGTGSVTTSAGTVNNTTTGSTGTNGATPPTTGGGSVSSGGGGRSISPDPQVQMANDLNNIHSSLNSSGLSAVTNAANLAGQSSSWSAVNNLTVTNSNATQVIKDIVELTSYGGLGTTFDGTSNVAQTLKDIQTVYPTMTASDLHSFFLSFENAAINQYATTLLGNDNTAKQTAFADSLKSAVQANQSFKGLLGTVGLSVDTVANTWVTENNTIDPNHAALTALINAVLSNSGDIQ